MHAEMQLWVLGVTQLRTVSSELMWLGGGWRYWAAVAGLCLKRTKQSRSRERMIRGPSLLLLRIPLHLSMLLHTGGVAAAGAVSCSDHTGGRPRDCLHKSVCVCLLCARLHPAPIPHCCLQQAWVQRACWEACGAGPAQAKALNQGGQKVGGHVGQVEGSCPLVSREIAL
jgi:hypothetical protein